MKTEKQDCYEIITDRIIGLLEQGVVPWQKPWKSCGGMPYNLVSKKPYRGMNVWLLHSLNYEQPAFLTYKQAQELGGNVKRGEKACPIVFWRTFDKVDSKGDKQTIPMMRFYYVFNVAQCENIPADKLPALEGPDKLPVAFNVADAENIVTGFKNAPAVKHGMERTCYHPGGDWVDMPDNSRFKSIGHYYAILFHELAHSTGHVSRLNRKGNTGSEGAWGSFGSAAYAREELCAEMASAFLCGVAGIADTGGLLENAAAYVANWLTALRNDKKLVVQAAGLAQRASDYILNVVHEKQSETQTAPVEATETVNA